MRQLFGIIFRVLFFLGSHDFRLREKDGEDKQQIPFGDDNKKSKSKTRFGAGGLLVLLRLNGLWLSRRGWLRRLRLGLGPG
jgi:hypothetical protein